VLLVGEGANVTLGKPLLKGGKVMPPWFATVERQGERGEVPPP